MASQDSNEFDGAANDDFLDLLHSIKKAEDEHDKTYYKNTSSSPPPLQSSSSSISSSSPSISSTPPVDLFISDNKIDYNNLQQQQSTLSKNSTTLLTKSPSSPSITNNNNNLDSGINNGIKYTNFGFFDETNDPVPLPPPPPPTMKQTTTSTTTTNTTTTPKKPTSSPLKLMLSPSSINFNKKTNNNDNNNKTVVVKNLSQPKNEYSGKPTDLNDPLVMQQVQTRLIYKDHQLKGNPSIVAGNQKLNLNNSNSNIWSNSPMKKPNQQPLKPFVFETPDTEDFFNHSLDDNTFFPDDLVNQDNDDINIINNNSNNNNNNNNNHNNNNNLDNNGISYNFNNSTGYYKPVERNNSTSSSTDSTSQSFDNDGFISKNIIPQKDNTTSTTTSPSSTLLKSTTQKFVKNSTPKKSPKNKSPTNSNSKNNQPIKSPNTKTKKISYEAVTFNTRINDDDPLLLDDDDDNNNASPYKSFNRFNPQTTKLEPPKYYKELNSKFTIHDLKQFLNTIMDSIYFINWAVHFDNDKTSFRNPVPQKKRTSDGKSVSVEEEFSNIHEPLAVSLWIFQRNHESIESRISKYFITIFDNKGGDVNDKLQFMAELLAMDVHKVSFNSQDSLKPFLKYDPWVHVYNLWDPKITSWVYETSPKLMGEYQFDSLCNCFVTKDLISKVEDAQKIISLEENEGFTLTLDSKDIPSNNYLLFVRDMTLSSLLYVIVNYKIEFEKKTYLRDSFSSEMDVIPILAKMEINGVYFSPEAMKPCEIAIEAYVDDLQQTASKTYNIGNVRSNQQIKEKLYSGSLGLVMNENIKKKMSSDKKTLIELKSIPANSHIKLMDIVLEHRHCSKVLSTYIKPYLELSKRKGIKDGEGLSIKSNWIHTGTGTGRLASQKPNLQNIPKNAFAINLLELDDFDDDFMNSTVDMDTVIKDSPINIRDCFKARDGTILVGLDYNQVELRVLAHFSEDSNLIDAFFEGKDVLCEAAALSLNKPVDQITKIERERTKHIVYGIIYGIGTKSLSQVLKVSESEASSFKSKFLGAFKQIQKFITDTPRKAERDGNEVRTIANRRRTLPNLKSSAIHERLASQRQAVNSIIQGSAADLLKKAMINIERLLRKETEKFKTQIPPELYPKLLLQIHDELIYEIPQIMFDNNLHLKIFKIMERVGCHFNLSVPLSVSMSIGTSWGSLQPFQSKMICIECGRPVNDVYKEFGKSGSGNIRLTRCSNPSCQQIADKYVEYDFIIVFLDLFLHKAQAYRHLLFNRQPYRDYGISVLRILRMANNWENQQQQNDIRHEARREFHKFMTITSSEEISKKIEEARERVLVAAHYKIPYARKKYTISKAVQDMMPSDIDPKDESKIC
eukprot:gene7503-9220_t